MVLLLTIPPQLSRVRGIDRKSINFPFSFNEINLILFFPKNIDANSKNTLPLVPLWDNKKRELKHTETTLANASAVALISPAGPLANCLISQHFIVVCSLFPRPIIHFVSGE